MYISPIRNGDFPVSLVYLWFATVRCEEKSSQKISPGGGEFHGDLPWYFVDFRRLFCTYGKQNVILQESISFPKKASKDVDFGYSSHHPTV